MRDLYILIGLIILASGIAYAGYTLSNSITTSLPNIKVGIS